MIAINMEMPKCCHWNCPLCNEDGGACMLGAYDPKTDTKKERAKDCPLVEIVTCKNCKHKVFLASDNDGKITYMCDKHCKNITDEDFYCADAERRE